MQHVRVWIALVALGSLAAGLAVAGAPSAGTLVDLPRLLVTPTSGAAADLCLALAGAGSCLAGAWLGLVTTVAALDHLQCGVPQRSAALRPRLVRALAGAGLACIGAQPAVAAGPSASSDHAPPLPVRPVSIRDDVMATLSTPTPPVRADAASTVSRVQVRPGDALWSIAARLVPPDATAADIDRVWRDIYADNRQRIGDDPDLLHPGTVLTVPDLGPVPGTDTDTASDTDTRPARSRHP